jgi:ethanolamine permease
MCKAENTVKDQSHLKAGSFGWPSLALLGISITAAGYYAPWSLALDLAGPTGVLISFMVTAVFYYCLIQCLAEMSASLPSSGAGQAFLERAFGPAAGYAAGAAALVQWVCGAAALMVILSVYIGGLTDLPALPSAIAVYVFIIAMLIAGAGEVVALSIVTSMGAVLGVLVFLFYTGKPVAAGDLFQVVHHPYRLSGVWMALPFCVTFFLGVEGVPFAAEEAIEPGKNVPRGMKLALVTVFILGILLLIIGPAGVGLEVFSGSSEPIIAGLSGPSLEVPNLVMSAVNVGAVAALAASLFGSVFSYSRLVFAMARAHELPSWLAVLNKRKAPVWALLAPSAISLTLAAAGLLDQLIVLTVMAACLYYAMMFAAFIRLRSREPELHRPYRVGKPVLVMTLGVLSGCLILSSCVASDPVWSSLAGAMLAILAGYRIFLHKPVDVVVEPKSSN